MLEPSTPRRELASLLDVFRLGLAIHLVAEARVLRTLVSLVRPPPALRLQIDQLRTEHTLQQTIAERMVAIEAGSDAWLLSALELRVSVLDVLKTEGFIRGYAAVEHSNGRKELEIELKYFDGAPVIRDQARSEPRGSPLQ